MGSQESDTTELTCTHTHTHTQTCSSKFFVSLLLAESMFLSTCESHSVVHLGVGERFGGAERGRQGEEEPASPASSARIVFHVFYILGFCTTVHLKKSFHSLKKEA